MAYASLNKLVGKMFFEEMKLKTRLSDPMRYSKSNIKKDFCTVSPPLSPVNMSYLYILLVRMFKTYKCNRTI